MKISKKNLRTIIESYLLLEEAPPFNSPEKNNEFRVWANDNIGSDEIKKIQKAAGLKSDLGLSKKGTAYNQHWYAVWDQHGEDFLKKTRTWTEYFGQTYDDFVGNTDQIPGSSLPEDLERQRKYIASKWRIFSGIDEKDGEKFLLISEKSQIAALISGANFSVLHSFPVITGKQAKEKMDKLDMFIDRYGMGEYLLESGLADDFVMASSSEKKKIIADYWDKVTTLTAKSDPHLERFTKTGRFTIRSFSDKDKKYGAGLFVTSRGQGFVTYVLGRLDTQMLHGPSDSDRAAKLRSAANRLSKNGEISESYKNSLEASFGCLNASNSDLEKLKTMIGTGSGTQVYIISETGDLVYSGFFPEFLDIITSIAEISKKTFGYVIHTALGLWNYGKNLIGL